MEKKHEKTKIYQVPVYPLSVFLDWTPTFKSKAQSHSGSSCLSDRKECISALSSACEAGQASENRHGRTWFGGPAWMARNCLPQELKVAEMQLAEPSQSHVGQWQYGNQNEDEQKDRIRLISWGSCFQKITKCRKMFFFSLGCSSLSTF